MRLYKKGSGQWEAANDSPAKRLAWTLDMLERRETSVNRLPPLEAGTPTA